MCESRAPANGADSAQSLANSLALADSVGYLDRLDLACQDCGATYTTSERHRCGAIIPACIACSERAEPTSVWCRYHRLRIEEEDAL
jgi:NAD-dependent SIR2 family protein deacetylase